MPYEESYEIYEEYRDGETATESYESETDARKHWETSVLDHNVLKLRLNRVGRVTLFSQARAR